MKKSILAFLCAFSFTAFAQEETQQISTPFSNNLISDRPGISFGANVLDHQTFQLEGGTNWLRPEYSDKERSMTTYAEARIGLKNNFEVSLGGGRSSFSNYPTAPPFENHSNYYLQGRKALLQQPKKWLDHLDLIAQFNVYQGSNNADHIRLFLVADKYLGSGFTLGLNIDYILDTFGTSASGSVLAVDYAVLPGFHVFSETKAINERQFLYFINDLGLAFMLSPKVQLDVYGMYDLHVDRGGWFINAGLVIRP